MDYDPSTELDKLTDDQLRRMLDRTCLGTVVRQLAAICHERASEVARATPTGREREWADAEYLLSVLASALPPDLTHGAPEIRAWPKRGAAVSGSPHESTANELPEGLRDPVWMMMERGRQLLAAMPCWCPHCRQPHGVNQTPATDAFLARSRSKSSGDV